MKIMQFILYVVAVLLIVLGLVEVIRMVVFFFYDLRKASDSSLVLNLTDADKCEFQIRRAAQKMRWLDLEYSCKLICVNSTGDSEIDKICTLLSKRYPYLVVSNLSKMEYNVDNTD